MAITETKPSQRATENRYSNRRLRGRPDAGNLPRVDGGAEEGIDPALPARAPREGEKYGFQILHELKDRSNGFFDLKEGTLYPALRRLDERGFVSSRWQEPASRLPRKYYRPTDRGRVALREALAIWDAMTRGAERVLGGGR